MKSNFAGRVMLVVAFALALTVSVRPGQNANHKAPAHPAAPRSVNNPNGPVKLIGAILVPGNPLRFDISWVDQTTARYYLAEGGNAGVDVFDAENDLYLGRIGGFHGVGQAGDPCGPIEGMGPNGVVVTPDNHLWADDAHGTVKVFELSAAQPPFTDLMPISTFSTGAQFRADKIGFDQRITSSWWEIRRNIL